jgi:malonate transporter
MNDFAIRTSLPIFLLIGTGFISRKVGILRSGDERVLSAYVYYFALPALFFVNMAETELTREMLMFAASGAIPLAIAVLIHIALYLFGFSSNTLYLLVVTTVFGSHANFGIPFIIFAFPTSRGENLAILAASSISIFAVTISLVALELYRLGSFTPWQT